MTISVFSRVRTTRSKTAVDPRHLKINEQDISLTKNCCITISFQSISSIHKFIINIHQKLGSHELNGHGHFSPHPPIITHESTFIIELNLYQHAKKKFIPSANFLDTVNFCINMHKIGLFQLLILQV